MVNVAGMPYARPAMLRLFVDNLLPVLLAAAVGYLAASRWRLDPKPLARLAFNVFAPCLVYQLLVDNRIPGVEALRMVGFALAVLLSAAVLAGLAARVLGASRTMVAAVVLAVLLPNAGNYGLAVNLFAFGEAGLAQGSLFFVTSAMLTFTVGVVVASAGRASLGSALLGLVKVPAIWSTMLAIFMLNMSWDLPLVLARPVGLFSQAAIPSFLLLLGMQLHGVRWRGRTGSLALVVGARLLGGLALAWLLAPLLGLDGTARQAGILQAAMPSAVVGAVLATEYDVEPDFVTAVVFASTLASPLTLTPLLALLGA